MPLASLELAPPELSLPGEPCPLSQASCFLAGSLSDCPRRSACRSFAAAFAVRASPFEPGRRILAVASPVASTHPSVNRTFPSAPCQHWARRMTAGTPASKPCSPRESVPRRPSPWPDGSHAAGALLGFSPSRALSTTVRVRSLVSTHARSSKPLPRTPPGIQPPRLHSAIRTPTPGSRAQDPSIRASIERSASPSSGDPAHKRFASAMCASRQPRSTPCRASSNGASCPCPLSAAPRASLPLAAHPLVEGARRWTSKTQLS